MSSNSRLARDAKAIRDQTGLSLSKAKRLVQEGARPAQPLRYTWSRWESLGRDPVTSVHDYRSTVELITEDGGIVTLVMFKWGTRTGGFLDDVKYSYSIYTEWADGASEDFNGDGFVTADIDEARRVIRQNAKLIVIRRGTDYRQPYAGSARGTGGS